MARHQRIPHCGREPRELVRVSRRRDVSAVSEVVDEPQEKHVEERAAARPPRQACLLLDQLAKIADGRRAQVLWRSSVERRSTEVSDNDATALEPFRAAGLAPMTSRRFALLVSYFR